MKYLVIIALLGILAVLPNKTSYADNPAEDAMSCLAVSTSTFEHDNLQFQNNCSYRFSSLGVGI